jgi:histidyl-tRNA synthetase
MCLGVQQAQAEGIDVDPLFLAPRPADAPESLVWPPAGVPRFRLSPQSAARHAAVLAGLGALGVRFSLDPLLFRGLDYYCHTAFEFVARSGANAGSAVLSGGRYDGLSARFGGAGAGAGAEFEAVGWAAGVERLILQLEERGLCPPAPVGAHVVVVAMTAPVPNAIQYNSDLACALAPTPDTVDAAADTGAGVGVGTGAVVAAGLRLAEQLRSVTVPGSASTGAVNSGAAEGTLRVSFTPARPWRSQLAAAGAEERALVAVIIGEDELRDGLAVVKDLRARTQSKVATADVAAEVARIVAAAH